MSQDNQDNFSDSNESEYQQDTNFSESEYQQKDFFNDSDDEPKKIFTTKKKENSDYLFKKLPKELNHNEASLFSSIDSASGSRESEKKKDFEKLEKKTCSAGKETGSRGNYVSGPNQFFENLKNFTTPTKKEESINVQFSEKNFFDAFLENFYNYCEKKDSDLNEKKRKGEKKEIKKEKVKKNDSDASSSDSDLNEKKRKGEKKPKKVEKKRKVEVKKKNSIQQKIHLNMNNNEFKKKSNQIINKNYNNNNNIEVTFEDDETKKKFEKKLKKKKINEKRKFFKKLPKELNHNEASLFSSILEDFNNLIKSAEFKEEDNKKIKKCSESIVLLSTKLNQNCKLFKFACDCFLNFNLMQKIICFIIEKKTGKPLLLSSKNLKFFEFIIIYFIIFNEKEIPDNFNNDEIINFISDCPFVFFFF
jgi:hypothetical protein